MSIDEAVKVFIDKTVNKFGGKTSEYFCGMTNNPERRKKEHGASDLLFKIKCSDKDCARKLMRSLFEAGFDVDKDIMSGQDDSVNVYVYKKTNTTKQQLSRSVSIEFQKRWYSEDLINDLPQTRGIYCCFVCDKKLVDNTFQNSKPLYIGMAANGFRDRIVGHKSKDHDKWKKNQEMGADKQLVYAIAEFDDEILQTVESAIICENKTPENTEYCDGYQGEYHTITVNCIGYKDGLKGIVTATFKG